MDEAIRRVVGVLVALVLVAGWVAMHIRVRRKVKEKREWYRQHPEEFPSRRDRMRRVAPWALASGAGAIWGLAKTDWTLAAMGGFACAGFALLCWRIATGREDL